jgi:hypothetical protein
MLRGEAWRSPGLFILLAELLKPVPVSPDRLHIEVENGPDFVAGRNWVEATNSWKKRQHREMVSRVSVHPSMIPSASSAVRSLSMSAVTLGKRKRTSLSFGQLSECLTRISKRSMDTFSLNFIIATFTFDSCHTIFRHPRKYCRRHSRGINISVSSSRMKSSGTPTS